MKLLEQVAAACRTMSYAPTTEECYTAWMVDYLQFHRRRAGKWVHTDHLREAEAEAFLSNLAVDRRFPARSQTQALSALVFLSRELGRPARRPDTTSGFLRIAFYPTGW